LLFGGWLSLFLAVGSAPAQPPLGAALPASLERPRDARPEQRAELQRELERQVSVLEAQSAVVKLVAKLMQPAVVHIEADIPPEANPAYNRSRHVEEVGSGVIIERKHRYYVLTNRHVVRGAAPPAISINLADGRLLHPTEVLDDRKTDVAVLPISAPDLVAASLGDSSRMQIGDFVVAVGSPFGLSHSVTFGIISAKGRRDFRLAEADQENHVDFQDFLQTDAAINPGNSGGPLVNLRGEVIGINTAIASHSGGNEGVGFSIPINMFMAVGRQLIETGKVTRAFLGVHMNSKAEFGPAMAAELGLPRPIGAYISGVIPSSPAAAAKLQAGDVILEFNRTPVEDADHLSNLVGLTEPSKSVSMVIFRDRKPINLMIQVGDSSKFAP
jgi:serine protease Do